MKLTPLSLFVSAWVVSQGSAFATPFKLSQVIIPVPTVEEATPSPQPAAPQPVPVQPAPITPAPEPNIDDVPPSTETPASPASSGVSDDLYFLTRAKNLARQAAINENGGLLLYRPEYSMYGPALQSPFTRNDDGSVTFTFKGGAPGATTLDKETEVRVDTNVGVSVVYNGPVRGTSATVEASEENASALAALDEDSFIARARNLARQAGISANGGLGAYRPEAAMFGPTSSAPFVKNEDGSVTFTFKGGAPASTAPTQETAVTVTRDGNVTVDFNRPIQN